jgi:hypothetical protein
MAMDLCHSYKLTLQTAEFGGFWPLKDIEKVYEIKDGNIAYNINSFEQIGWPDPFPIFENKSKGPFKKPNLT